MRTYGPMTALDEAPHRVLLSGGIDSAVVLAILVAAGKSPEAMWLDWSQASRDAERAASQRIAAHYSATWISRRVEWNPVMAGPGEVPGRNDMLVATAALGLRAGVVSIGIHAGTGYPDCSPEWVACWQAGLDRQSGGAVTLAAPLLTMTKGQICSLAVVLEVPLLLTHSCEAGDSDCGRCRSCQDRKACGVRA